MNREGMKQVTIQISDELHKQVKIHAATVGATLADLIAKWIGQGLKRDEGKKK